MNTYITICLLLLVCFVVYLALVRDKIFNSAGSVDAFESPAMAALEIRQAPIAPPRTITPSGPNPPAQSGPNNEVVIYGDPKPTDPFTEPQQASNAAETMRYPERSFRPTTANTQVQIAADAGIAGDTYQTSPQNYQKYGLDFIQNSGEFMQGVYANDVDNPTNFSTF